MLALKAENISKQYRLGQVGTGTLSHDLNRLWAQLRGKEDPYLKIGEANDRTTKGNSDYVWSLRDIHFEIEQGDAVGIIGRNGAGKSTLLKLLSKVTKPTTGKIFTKGRIASLLEVGTGFHPEMTGRENIYLNGAILGMTRKEITRKFDEIVDFSGVERYIDTPVKRYSSGMYVRLAFAVAAHLESEILIVDEVLAVGDAEFQKKCLGKMGDVSKGEGRTVLFVSHNMDSVSKLCNKGLYLKNGQIEYDGDIEDTIHLYSQEFFSKNNFLKKEAGIIKELKVEQKNTNIELTCKFDFGSFQYRPYLGFTITDLKSNTICGTNMKITKPDFEIPLASDGTISCNIEYPKLMDGEYLLSVWLGDGLVDYEAIIEEVMFSVKNMKVLDYPSTIHANGCVIPEVSWKFK
ncbi:ABC transporter ATP-binding protein [Chryseobacterium koreense]|uniref:ABC transporter ATP-binding protein n=1 Tax=Chryseobacterium koreense TaxID=232216 RepID=UPI0026EA7CD6|nr:ABC transporter ATP-binding protein [Chryseobacterium koreense]